VLLKYFLKLLLGASASWLKIVGRAAKFHFSDRQSQLSDTAANFRQGAQNGIQFFDP